MELNQEEVLDMLQSLKEFLLRPSVMVAMFLVIVILALMTRTNHLQREINDMNRLVASN